MINTAESPRINVRNLVVEPGNREPILDPQLGISQGDW